MDEERVGESAEPVGTMEEVPTSTEMVTENDNNGPADVEKKPDASDDGDEKDSSGVVAVENAPELKDVQSSYNDTEQTVYGCKHYRRGCLIKAECCGKFWPCRLCHDEETFSHTIDR